MILGLYTSAGGALIENAKVAMDANNLANVKTPGFKPNFMVVRQRQSGNVLPSLSDLSNEDLTQAYVRQLAGLIIDRSYADQKAGPLTITDRPLDVAIQGQGYFEVTDGTHTYYTRAGNFALNAQGTLVTADQQFEVQTDHGPVHIHDANQVNVDSQGVLHEGTQVLGRLQVVQFQNPEDELMKVGDNLFQARPGASAEPSSSSVTQGSLEESGTDTMKELTGLIQSMRSFEANMQFIRLQDGLLNRMVNQTLQVAAA